MHIKDDHRQWQVCYNLGGHMLFAVLQLMEGFQSEGASVSHCHQRCMCVQREACVILAEHVIPG